jgi:hypothetical protein
MIEENTCIVECQHVDDKLNNCSTIEYHSAIEMATQRSMAKAVGEGQLLIGNKLYSSSLKLRISLG